MHLLSCQLAKVKSTRAYCDLANITTRVGGFIHKAEEPTGGFAVGGWMFSYHDKAMDISAGVDGKDHELVLGSKTYEIVEAYWPYQSLDNPIARTLNSAKKHVTSRTLKAVEWSNSSLLRGDVTAITALKAQSGRDLQIIGSGNLIQTFQAASLIDQYNVWVYPVVLGRGKRLFEDGAKPGALRLVAWRVSTTGVVMSTYVPTGDIPLASLGRSQAEPSAKELGGAPRWLQMRECGTCAKRADWPHVRR